MKGILLSSSGKGSEALKRGARSIILNDQEVLYTLKRRKCRAINLKIDCDGLTVSAPTRETLGWIESVLKGKSNWILKKLDEWKSKESISLVWEESSIFPLLGDPWRLAIEPTGVMKMIPVHIKKMVERDQLELPFATTVSSQEIEKVVMEWYYKQAYIYFSKRMEFFSKKLGVPRPQLKLSRAKTQWGSCNSRRIIHLNWRLIQLSISLVDYVIAHELSHLIEMNHSSAFWRTVESICPNYVANRDELKKIR
jgi:predicted metal-dependent hydrolase